MWPTYYGGAEERKEQQRIEDDRLQREQEDKERDVKQKGEARTKELERQRKLINGAWRS